MSCILRSFVLATALLALVGCDQGKDNKAQEAAPVAVTAPTDNNSQAWKLYLSTVAKQNMGKVRNSPYFYTLPPTDAEDFNQQYERQLDNVIGTVSRGVLPGNMLAFGSLSPDSSQIADLVVEAFQEAPAGSMKDVKVLFIGRPEDVERVQQAIAPSGADFVFADITA
jgi:hypothetical protein